jgi:Domain of unknown function (DUF3471)
MIMFVGWGKPLKQSFGWHARITADMERNRKSGTSARPLDKYVGRYFNAAGTLLLEVRRKDDRLFLLFEGREDEAFPLQHYQDDTFSWLQSRNELVTRARSVLQGASYYMIRFEASQQETVDRLFWTHDSQIPNGEEYVQEHTASCITRPSWWALAGADLQVLQRIHSGCLCLAAADLVDYDNIDVYLSSA